VYNYNQDLVPRARDMRKEPTPQERKLWYEFLRNHSTHWRRQKLFGSYIADFTCTKAKVIIELDGAHHQAQAEHDAERTRYLNACGYDVIRFSNREIDTQFEQVCQQIHEEIQRRIP